MEASFLTSILLPALLALIMFGMGLSLTIADFVRLFKMPRPIFVGLLGQLLCLPLIAYGIAIAFDLSSHLAIGLMIMSACPGGTVSNIISHLARANLALSVSLTAVTTVICIFTTPLVIQFAIDAFGEQGNTSFSLLATSASLFAVTVVPVVLGVAVRSKFPEPSIRSEAFFQRFSAGFMLFMIIAILIQERDILVSSFSQMFAATLALNLVAIAVGVALAYGFKLSARDGVTLSIEVGIQNVSTAILIAVTFLNTPAFATAAGVYGLTMYIGTFLLLWVARSMY